LVRIVYMYSINALLVYGLLICLLWMNSGYIAEDRFISQYSDGDSISVCCLQMFN